MNVTAIRYFVAALGLFCLLPTASAENWYISIGLGAAEQEDMLILGVEPNALKSSFDELNAVPDTEARINIDNKDLGGRLSVGYEFTRYFAVEGGYTNLGTPQRTNGTIERELTEDIDTTFNFRQAIHIKGIHVAAVGQIPVSDLIRFTGKVGLYSWDLERDLETRLVTRADDTETEAVNGTDSDSGSDSFIGLGMEIGWFNLFYEQYDIDGDNVDFIGLGSIIRF